MVELMEIKYFILSIYLGIKLAGFIFNSLKFYLQPFE